MAGILRSGGKPSWANDSRFNRVEDRKHHEYELDQEITSWSSRLKAGDVMTRLQSFGIRAGVVQSVPDLFSCPQLVHRRHGEDLITLSWKALSTSRRLFCCRKR